jgi:DeoR/GlpR family transcriptional regulator of sugar metabolism
MRNTDSKILKDRREYIAERISKVKHPSSEVNKIARELFLSTDTVYRDLREIGFEKKNGTYY